MDWLMTPDGTQLTMVATFPGDEDALWRGWALFAAKGLPFRFAAAHGARPTTLTISINPAGRDAPSLHNGDPNAAAGGAGGVVDHAPTVAPVGSFGPAGATPTHTTEDER